MDEQSGSGGEAQAVPSTRQILKQKLLTALDEGETVAILTGRIDLALIIRGLGCIQEDSDRARELRADLRKLELAAFE